MKNRYRLYRRRIGGVFYVHDSETRKQESLGTHPTTLLKARNESIRQPQLNLHIARAIWPALILASRPGPDKTPSMRLSNRRRFN